jgi:REP element-mobilizing transposase RayT
MNRGGGRKDIFLEDEHCDLFLQLVQETVERYEIRVHGFVLMPNHYHLMIESVHGNLSKAMAKLGGRYTQSLNWEVQTDGSLFRGRFNNRVVVDPAHWRYLLAYLHLNPIRARLVTRINQWRWSSHRFYSGKTPVPHWLDTGNLWNELDGADGYRRYVSEIRQGRREMPDDFDQILFGRRRSSGIQVLAQPEQSRAVSVEEALQQVARVSGQPIEQMSKQIRGRAGNPVRVLAAWWLTIGAGCSNGQAGERLNLSPVAVCKAIARVKRELARHPEGEIYDWAMVLGDLKGH